MVTNAPVIVVGVLLFVSSVTSSVVLNLGGIWKVEDTSQTYLNLKANVPGGIYTDLMENKVIGDVLYGYRDVESRWVAYENWTYYRNFDVSDVLYSYRNIKLIFDGVDTFSTIFLNNQPVGVTDNMFVQYIFDISPYIQVGTNLLEVRFVSPVQMATYLYDRQAQDYVVPPNCVPPEYKGECHANHIRKMQASFAWDWGPALPSVGIWKPVRIEAYNSTQIRDVTVTMKPDDQSDTWDITVTTYLDSNSDGKMFGNLIIRLHTDVDVVESIYELSFSRAGSGEFVHTAMFTIPKLHVKLWWPNGYGNPQLYFMTVTYQSASGESSVKSMNVGFRTIALMQNPIGTKREAGLSFYFIVNNIPIFAKGSNSIPFHILPEKGYNSSTIKFVLQSAKVAHMNMIRVWGGGVYESDEFYNVADELGIMVWQDFMFACAMYPVNDEFLMTVKQEVRHQVRRLQHHPSIILWAGNNENEAALRQNWYDTFDNFELYKADYIKLYVNTIRPEVFKIDSSREFLTSSPTNGIRSEMEGYIANNPASTYYGDVHFYDYLTDSWDQTGYPIPRFSSEYGLQSLPSISTLLTVTNSTTDLSYDSDFLNHRQHHPGGNDEMLALMGMRLPLVATDNPNFYRAYIFYSQIHQAMGMKLQTEKYRIWRSSVNSADEGFTMGALFWQLNDCWVAPTWAGIDFNLKWKMLHYFAKRFFSPVLIAGYQSSARKVSIHVVSDLITNVYNATTILTIYKWDSFDPVHVESHSVNAMAGISTSVTSFWIDTALAAAQCGTVDSARFNCFIQLALRDQSGFSLAPNNFIFPAPLKDSLVTDSILQVGYITQMSKDGLEFDVQVISDGIALFVWLEAHNIPGIFSDNGFLMITRSTVIKFYPNSPATVNDVKDSMSVTHLMDQRYF